jgi:hypothetical protein
MAACEELEEMNTKHAHVGDEQTQDPREVEISTMEKAERDRAQQGNKFSRDLIGTGRVEEGGGDGFGPRS